MASPLQPTKVEKMDEELGSQNITSDTSAALKSNKLNPEPYLRLLATLNATFVV
jgi:hypothetical protein